MPTLKYTKKLIALTAGDVDGIGLEVIAKALVQIGPQKNSVFFLFRGSSSEKKQKKYFDLIDTKFARLTFHSLNSALFFYKLLVDTRSFDRAFLFDLSLSTAPAFWVYQASLCCKRKILDSLVNAPLSKEQMLQDGFDVVGHTGIFRKIYPQKKLFMGFVGSSFSVLLATDHIPLSKVENILLKKNLYKDALEGSKKLRSLLGLKKPIAVLGLNPHAGEKNIIGTFESRYLLRLSSVFSKPISADAAFLKKNWTRYSVFLSWYHDQGLIPFKAVHGQDSGVHVTIGLPFVRTSVDHGTAKEIFNKNIANASSMIEAIRLNLKLVHGENL